METENKPMEIGEDWFCYGADFDSDEPHIILAHKDGGEEEKRMPVPKQLAYYLRTHWCGSQIMHDLITKNAKKSVTDGIREILGAGL
jgi:hypothetical protein